MPVSSERKLRAARAPDLLPAAAPDIARIVPRVDAHCAQCPWRSACIPQGLNFVELGQFDTLIGRERHLAKGQPLYVAGNAFHSLYALRSGAVRTTLVAEDGREQVAGYHILGEIVGMDGIATTRHGCTAVAAMATELCALPFDRLQTLAQTIPRLQHNLYRLLSHELSSHHERMLMLGSMDARERLAAFLLDLSERYRLRGRSPSALTLHLSREELGSYLGLKLETVSRGLSRLQAAGALQVQGRDVKLLDLPSLRALLGRNPRGPRD
jgi:CRP/FNR family transcriptional regulator